MKLTQLILYLHEDGIASSLKKDKIKLELLTGIDMLLMVKKGFVDM